DIIHRLHAAAIAVEAIGRPLSRRREIELAIALAGTDKRLETGVLPESVYAQRGGRRRDQNIPDLAVAFVTDNEVIRFSLNIDDDPRERVTRRSRMTDETCAQAHHSGSVVSPAPNARCMKTVSTQRPSLNPAASIVPRRRKPNRLCKAMDDVLALSPMMP